jgi:hypothetical protein
LPSTWAVTAVSLMNAPSTVSSRSTSKVSSVR